MDWVKQLEQKRTLLIGGLVIICFAMLAVTARRDPISYDLYWHIQTGMDWLKNGMSPWIEHYSFSFQGQAIKSQPVLFQVTIAWVVEQFGLEGGAHLVKFLGMAVTLGLTIVLLRKLCAPVVVYLLVLPSIVVLLEMRTMVRPEIFSYGLSVLAVILYYRARERITVAGVLPMVLLMLFWGNFHSSIFGYVIFFGFFVDAAWMMAKEKAHFREWITWLAWGVAIVAVGFLNPTVTHSIIESLTFPEEWKGFIQEYGSSSDRFRGNIAVYCVLVIAFLTICLAAWKRKPGLLVVTTVLFYNAILISRLVTPSGIIILCIFAILVSDAINARENLFLRISVSRVAAIFTLFVALVSIAYGVIIPRIYLKENRVSQVRYPASLIEYMKENDIGGNIFNEYGIGGYLIYNLYPDSRVWIDGRTEILYPPDHFSHYLQALNDPNVMTQVVDENRVDLAILKNDSISYAVTHNSGDFKLDFVDYRYSLFVKENAQFPLSGRLLAYPACWSESQVQSINSELVSALMALPNESPLTAWLASVVEFANSGTPTEYFENLEKTDSLDIHIARFAAYQALDLGLNEKALSFLSRVTVWDLGDFIAASIANIRLGKWSEAERLLDPATKIAWTNVTLGQSVLLYRVIKSLQVNGKLSLIDEKYIEGLKSNVIDMGLSIDDLTFDMDYFCNN